jgi:hypothetical protein
LSIPAHIRGGASRLGRLRDCQHRQVSSAPLAAFTNLRTKREYLPALIFRCKTARFLGKRMLSWCAGNAPSGHRFYHAKAVMSSREAADRASARILRVSVIPAFSKDRARASRAREFGASSHGCWRPKGKTPKLAMDVGVEPGVLREACSGRNTEPGALNFDLRSCAAACNTCPAIDLAGC